MSLRATLQVLSVDGNRELCAIGWSALLSGLDGGILEDLRLESCELDEEKAKAIGSRLVSLRATLRVLRVDENRELCAIGWSALLSGVDGGIGGILEDLRLERCELDEERAKAIGSRLTSLRATLRVLRVDGNRELYAIGWSALLSGLDGGVLEELCLERCELDEEKAKAIGSRLVSLKSLKKLDLQHCGLDDVLFDLIFSKIKAAPLKTLTITGNRGMTHHSGADVKAAFATPSAIDFKLIGDLGVVDHGTLEASLGILQSQAARVVACSLDDSALASLRHVALEGMVNLKAVELMNISGWSLDRCGEALTQHKGVLKVVGLAARKEHNFKSFFGYLAGGVVEHVFLHDMVGDDARAMEALQCLRSLRRLEVFDVPGTLEHMARFIPEHVKVVRRRKNKPEAIMSEEIDAILKRVSELPNIECFHSNFATKLIQAGMREDLAKELPNNRITVSEDLEITVKIVGRSAFDLFDLPGYIIVRTRFGDPSRTSEEVSADMVGIVRGWFGSTPQDVECPVESLPEDVERLGKRQLEDEEPPGEWQLEDCMALLTAGAEEVTKASQESAPTTARIVRNRLRAFGHRIATRWRFGAQAG